MRLYIIRHAHTQQDRTVDAARWRLSEQGQRQATALAREPFWKQVNRIVVSSEPKTRLTIEPVLEEYGLPITVDSSFDELRRGGWIEDYLCQVTNVFETPSRAVHGWESAASAQQRFLAGIAALAESYPRDTVALVGHGLILSIYRAYLLGQPRVELDAWQNLAFGSVAQVAPDTHQLVEDFWPAGHL